jgi:hypothetical protein
LLAKAEKELKKVKETAKDKAALVEAQKAIVETAREEAEAIKQKAAALKALKQF